MVRLGANPQGFTEDRWSLLTCRAVGSRTCSPVAKVTFSLRIASSDAAKAGSFLRMMVQLQQNCLLSMFRLS